MTVSERREDAFLDFILDLARRQADPSNSWGATDEPAQDGPEGPQERG